jgi:hypothetical protein
VTESNPLLEIAVSRISKRLNMPPDQVRAIVKPLFEKKDVVKEYEDLAKRVDALKELFAKLPEEARAHVLTHVIRSEIAKSAKSTSSLVSDAAVVRELLRGMGEDPEVKSLREEVRALRDVVSKLLEEQTKRSVTEEFRKEVDALRKELDEFKKLFEARPQQQPGVPEDVKKLIEEKLKSIEERIARLEQQPQQQSFKTTIGQVLKELKETVELAKEYGLIREATGQAQSQPLDPEKMAEELKKYGYEVKRATLSREEIEKIIESVRRQAYEDAMREAGIERERAQQVGQIITTAIKEVLSPVVKTIAEAQRDYMREALRARLHQQLVMQQATQQLSQQQAQSQQQVAHHAQTPKQEGQARSGDKGERQGGG